MRSLLKSMLSFAVGSSVAVVVSVIAGLVSNGAEVASAHTVTNVHLIAQHSGKCIRHQGGTGNGGSLIQATCTNDSAQQVDILPAGSGYHYIRFRHSNRCLTVNGWDGSDNALLDQWDCLGQDNQKWSGTFQEGTFAVHWSKFTYDWGDAKCITVYQESQADGAWINSYDCVYNANQYFKQSAPPLVRWDILPGLNYSSIYEYGWHFDEGGSWFGARDFNRDPDGGLTASLRANTVIALPNPTRYRLVAGTCSMTVYAEVNVGGQWYVLSGSNMHFLHINQAASGTTSTMQALGTSISQSVGTVASTGTTCAQGFSSHLHESADLSSSSVYIRTINTPDDTCWTDTTSQCSSYGWNRDWTSCTTFTWGSYQKTGTIAEYVCSPNGQEWSKQNHGQSYPVFRVRWQ